MTSADFERFTRERLDADRRYNDALTALDRTVVGLAGRRELARDDLLELCSVLIVFLQQITAYVDTKHRESAAATDARLAAHDEALRGIADLDQRLASVVRSVHGLRRVSQPAAALSDPDSATPIGSPAASGEPPAVEDALYVGFEDRFRGSAEEITARLRPYASIFASHADVLDIGCGRGEFLALLRDAGVTARGVDANREMIALTRQRGLEAVDGDALSYLRSLPPGSLGGLMASQIVEHLTPSYLVALLDTAHDKLRAGSPIVIETINPACWLAFFSSYLRDFTHRTPVHPETLKYLAQATGFGGVTVRYASPVPDEVRMKNVEIPAGVAESTDPVAQASVDAARVANANAAILNNLLFSHLDYAVIGYRSSRAGDDGAD